jgi:hypothetical protein
MNPLLRRGALGAVLLAITAAALAQVVMRLIPDDARRGVLSHVAETTFALDGRTVKLAPGGTIRNAANLLIMPITLPRDSLVKYRTNAQGEIVQAWILTPEEAARPDKALPKGGLAVAPMTGLGGSPAGNAGSSYTEPPGTPIDRVLGTQAPSSGYGPPPSQRQ